MRSSAATSRFQTQVPVAEAATPMARRGPPPRVSGCPLSIVGPFVIGERGYSISHSSALADSQMSRPRPWRMLLGLLVAALAWPESGDGQSAAPPAGEWRSYGNDQRSTRYSPRDQITRDKVRNLQVAWTWKFDNFGSPAETVTTQTTPIM